MNHIKKKEARALNKEFINSLLLGYGINIVLAFVIIYFFLTPSFSWSKSFGFDLKALLVGFAGGILSLFIVLIWQRISIVNFPINESTSEIIHLIQKPWGPVFISVGSGIAEELLFRAAIFGLLNYYFGTLYAVLLVSIIFMVLHIPQYKEVPSLNFIMFIVSIIFTVSYVLSQSLWTPIIAHVLYNYVISIWLKSGFLKTAEISLKREEDV